MQAQYRAVWLGGQQREYRVRRSRRARHVLLHVHLSGAIEVVVPWRAAWREAEHFIREKQAWVARVLADNAQKRLVLPRRRFVSGEQLPILGETRELLVKVAGVRARTVGPLVQRAGPPRRRAGMRRASVVERGTILVVTVPPGRPVRPALVRWYRRQAARYFSAETARLAARLKAAAPRVAVSDARTQWGSCVPHRGRVALHWRLLLGPRAAAEYVAAHEVAHLKVRRHSARFWRLVGELMPGFEAQRAWLRRFGYTLVL